MQELVSLYLLNLLVKKSFALDNTAYQEGNQKERQVI